MAYLSPYFVAVKLIDFSKFIGRLTHYFLRGQKSIGVKGFVEFEFVVEFVISDFVLLFSPKTTPSMIPNRTSTTAITRPPIIFLFLYQTSAFGSYYVASYSRYSYYCYFHYYF
jgi:hypothetical protein